MLPLRQDGLPFNEDELPFLEDFNLKMPNLGLFYPIYGIFRQNRLIIRVIKSVPDTVMLPSMQIFRCADVKKPVSVRDFQIGNNTGIKFVPVILACPRAALFVII